MQSNSSKTASPKEDRAAAALRENLRKRKAQRQEREAGKNTSKDKE